MDFFKKNNPQEQPAAPGPLAPEAPQQPIPTPPPPPHSEPAPTPPPQQEEKPAPAPEITHGNKPGMLNYQGVDYVPARAVANDAYHIHKGSRVVAIIGVAASFAVALTHAIPYPIGLWVGAGMAGIVTIGFAFFIWKDTSRMKYLASEYRLQVKR